MAEEIGAGLETVGREQFTIKMLQEALGLSYHQTYRVLHGYASRGTTCSGLLDKCPAVSFFDTMIPEDGEGYAVRRDVEISGNRRRHCGCWLTPLPETH